MKRHSKHRSRPKPPTAKVATYTIDDTTHEGNGVARQDGKVIFVSGAIKGEEVEAKIIKTGRQFDQAEPVRWQVESPHRVTPPCEYFERCGGCQLQHMNIAEQRQVKTHWLANQFRKLALPESLSTLFGEPFGYRRRARLSVFAKGGKVDIGFRAKASNSIVDIAQCPVLAPPLQVAYEGLRERIKATAMAGKIGHLELLKDGKGVSVVIRLTRDVGAQESAELEQWAHQTGVSLYWQAADQERLSEDAIRSYQIDEMKVNFHAQDFIQVNDEINQAMVHQAMDWLALNQNDVVLDLFCGAGNFSLPLARRASKVIAVEALESMVAMGRNNAAQAKLDNLEFIAADLTQAPPNALKKAKVNKVLLDPPRAGAYECLPTLVKLKPTQILYVSCNASTLARDAEYLLAHGYRVSKVCIMDMFPQTSHVETMMLLQN